MLLATPVELAEYAILADGNIQKLHKVSIAKNIIFPMRYELRTDTAYFECEDGSIQYIRLNQPALDSQYYTLKLNKENGHNEWDVSGSWLITSGGQAYYQYEEPALVITSISSESEYKKDVSLTISVANEADKKDVSAKVTVFNYPVKI